MSIFDKVELERLLTNLYSGAVNSSRLPVDLYNATLTTLLKAVYKGFGNTTSELVDGSPEMDLLKHYEHNIAIFSGAKTFQQIKDMSSLVFTEDGYKRDYSEFKKLITGDKFHEGIFAKYNKNYLKTEYNTALSTAQMGREWLQIEDDADVFPYLKYVTAHDERVRHTHQLWDGVVRPVGDDFWTTRVPPNGFNCRCRLMQLNPDDDVFSVTPDDVIKTMPKTDSPLFQMNPAKSGYIFDPSIHPYTKNVEERFKVSASQNFGFPTPPKPAPLKPTPKIVVPEEKKVETSDVFQPQKTIKALNEYAKNILGLDYCDFSGGNIDVANLMVKGAFESVQKMPELKDVVRGFGTHQNRAKRVKAGVLAWAKESQIYEDYVNRLGVKYADDWANKFTEAMTKKRLTTRALAYQSPEANLHFSMFDENPRTLEKIERKLEFPELQGIFYNTAKIKSEEVANSIVIRGRKTKYFAEGSSDFSYIITHEYGHAIDELIGFRKDPDFEAIFQREHAKGILYIENRLSRYGATAGDEFAHRRHEMIAESWAEFVTSPEPRELSKEIGELILKKYKLKFKK